MPAVGVRSLEPGAVVAGTFEVLRPLGTGSMGAVYEARDRLLNRLVALKVSSTAAYDASLWTEARSLAVIDHAALPRIYAAGEQGGVPYIVMERVSGTSLKKRMNEQRADRR